MKIWRWVGRRRTAPTLWNNSSVQDVAPSHHRWDDHGRGALGARPVHPAGLRRGMVLELLPLGPGAARLRIQCWVWSSVSDETWLTPHALRYRLTPPVSRSRT